LAAYWSFGQFWGVWVILVLEFQRQHSLTDSHLGLLYSLLSVAAILTMLAGAPRLQRLSLRASVPSSLATLAIAALALAVGPRSMLVVTFVLVGIGNGLIDVYVNVAAQREEHRTRRPVLQWLHASYALGGVTGAAAAGALRTVGLDHRLGLAASGVALLATAWWNLQSASREPAAEGATSVLSVSALRRSPALWIPALTVLFCFLVEGSMDIWSGLYLREELGASPAAAGAAFAAFAGSLFVGRLFAAKVLFGLGPRRTIVIAGIGGRGRRDDRRARPHDAGRGRRLPRDGIRDVRGRPGGVQSRGGDERRSQRDRGRGDRGLHRLRVVSAPSGLDRRHRRPAGGDGGDRAGHRRDHGDRALRPIEAEAKDRGVNTHIATILTVTAVRLTSSHLEAGRLAGGEERHPSAVGPGGVVLEERAEPAVPGLGSGIVRVR
jgi:hypothetical protein